MFTVNANDVIVITCVVLNVYSIFVVTKYARFVVGENCKAHKEIGELRCAISVKDELIKYYELKLKETIR